MSVPLVRESTPSTMNYYLSFVLLVSAVSQIDAAVNVTFYYESLCKDCVNFIRDQMWPTYVSLKDKLYMDFVPFGKACWTTNPWSITCQHGPRECHGNAIQACALERYDKPEMQMKFIYCVMTESKPDEAGEKCAKQLGYNYTGIAECAVGEEGKKLHIKHGMRTKAFKPTITFIPTIAFDDKYNEQDQKESLKNFKKVVCSKFPEDKIPPECKDKQSDESEEFFNPLLE